MECSQAVRLWIRQVMWHESGRYYSCRWQQFPDEGAVEQTGNCRNADCRSFRSIDFALSSMSQFQYSAGSGVDTVQFQIAESASELFEMVGFRKKAGWTVRISADGYFGQ